MNTETISIHTDYIQLDQLLKYANILITGGQIKELLAEELITLNGTIVTEKRKKSILMMWFPLEMKYLSL